MLTSDLSMNRRRGDRLFPLHIQPDNPGFLRDAAALLEIFEEFQGGTRGELERELEEYIGTGTDYRILRGFIKLLTDRCEFAASGVADPAEIRQKLFLEARKFQPVLPGSPQRREILESVAAEFQTDAAAILAGLYADLSAQQKLVFFDPLGTAELLERYNLAQAQALLYRCLEMRIRVAPSRAENYRAIFGWIKHFGLIHSVSGSASAGYEITLTGAASLFHRSQKYGVRMAVFLPALLLCENWQMRAEIAQKEGGSLFYELSSDQTLLKSSYEDEPEYQNSDIERLKNDWAKAGGLEWQLRENREVVDLGKTAFVPDFALVPPGGGGGDKIYLDVLGFWTPKSLKKRLDEFRAAGFRRFIFAAGQDLRGSREEPLWESENVLFYKTKILPREVENLAGRLAGPE